MVLGSCLCGTVRYEIRGRVRDLSNCHCSMCRKAHGASFSTYAHVDPGDFAYLQGEDSVVRFRSSPEVERTFCGRCGSNLTFRFEGMPASLWVAAGSLDDDPGVRTAFHIFAASKAPWVEIVDALPQYPEYPPEDHPS